MAQPGITQGICSHYYFWIGIGISSSLVIFLIAQYDFSFYKFEKDAGHIYRLVSDNGDQ